MSDDEIEQPEWINESTAVVLAHKGYILQYKIGAGAFGVVYKVERRFDDGRRVVAACKILDLTVCDESMKQKFLPREIHSLSTFRHPYAIEVYDIFRMSEKVWIMMEYAGGGTVEGYCLKQKRPLSEDHAGYWFNQMCSAITALHASSLAHRDLKLENVMLDHKLICKVTDFGFARVVSPEMSKTFCGTWIFFCPELVALSPYDPFLADAWALGVMLYGMVCRRWPFHYDDQEEFWAEQHSQAFKGKREFENLSDDLRDLLINILDPNPKTRLHVSQMLKHPWLVKYRRRPTYLKPIRPPTLKARPPIKPET